MARIVVIHREDLTPASLARYYISLLTPHWNQLGHEVIHLFGPSRFVPGDIALLHVDLTIVPKSYLRLADRYPVALNRRIIDIRKRIRSQLLVCLKDRYEGPVIVKSNHNHGGLPEQKHRMKLRQAAGKSAPPGKDWLGWLALRDPKSPEKATSTDYSIYPSKHRVPPAIFKNRDFVVERFMPEQEEGFYYLRQAYFFGDRAATFRLRAAAPVIRAQEMIEDVEIPTPPQLERQRREAGLDYGKVDYVEHNGRIFILDWNKTIGDPTGSIIGPRLAEGINAWFSPSAGGR